MKVCRTDTGPGGHSEPEAKQSDTQCRCEARPPRHFGSDHSTKLRTAGVQGEKIKGAVQCVNGALVQLPWDGRQRIGITWYVTRQPMSIRPLCRGLVPGIFRQPPH